MVGFDGFELEIDDSKDPYRLCLIGQYSVEERIWLEAEMVKALSQLIVSKELQDNIRQSKPFYWKMNGNPELDAIEFLLSIHTDPQQISATFIRGVRMPTRQDEKPSNSNFDVKEFSSLTKREKEILKLILKGYNNTEIAKELFISQYTADGHRSIVYKKLGVHSFKELMKKWG